MSHKIKKASIQTFFDKQYTRLFIFLGISFISMIMCYYLNSIIDDYRIYHMEKIVVILIKMTKWTSILSSTILVVFSLILFSRKIYTYKTNNPYGYIICNQLDNWLYDVGICLIRGDYIIIPNVKIYKDNNTYGIDIEILGDLRDKMLNINSSLSSYIGAKGSDWYVSESYECKGGYIRYIFSKGIKNEQLRGDDVEL